MSEKDIADCSRVFSENYGEWSNAAASVLAGKAIRMLPGRIRSTFVDRPDRYVAMMYNGDEPIGHAFYLRRTCPWQPSKSVTFILQLVLVKKYRGRRLGLKLLQSIFGLSDDAAWGLFTSNPLTVRALEDATFRHVDVECVARRVQDMKGVLGDALDGTSWLDSFHDGCVDTNFAVNHSENPSKIEKAYPTGGFPFKKPLGDTEEWLAVVFQSQKIDFDAASLRILTHTSKEILRDAYSRMSVAEQGWTRFAEEECDYLFRQNLVKVDDEVLDLGCGIGRHSRALARRGCRVHGIDFSASLIGQARERSGLDGSVTFEQADILSYTPQKQYDVVLCVYDVIGSSTTDDDNRRIVDVIYKALKPDGIAVVSVMNLDLMRKICTSSENWVEKITDQEGFKKLVNLPPSKTMQNSGEIFKAQLSILEKSTGVIYRKEQFDRQDLMPVEYVIADRRYSKDDLKALFEKFEPLALRCVRAGGWDRDLMPTERHAKEILGIFRKKGSFWHF